MTSADSSQFVVTARRFFFFASSARPLQLWPHSFHLMSARFTLDDSDSYWTLASLAVLSSSVGLISGFCPSDQMFASGFLQIPSRGGHPCPLAVTFPLSGRFRDFHPLEYVRAGRTEKIVQRASARFIAGDNLHHY